MSQAQLQQPLEMPDIDLQVFKEAMADFPAAVTVITTWDDEGHPVGATLSAVSSTAMRHVSIMHLQVRARWCVQPSGAGAGAWHRMAWHRIASVDARPVARASVEGRMALIKPTVGWWWWCVVVSVVTPSLSSHRIAHQPLECSSRHSFD